MEQEIKDGNRLIAEYMGYTYYHKGVDVDTSDCGGIYERFEIFSKTPILVNEYPDADQYYFKQVPNPDYGNKNNPHWNPDIETLSWASLNDYLTDLKYHESWDALMPVVEKISKEFNVSLSSVGLWACYITRQDSDPDDSIADFGGFDPMILNVWKSVVKFLEWYNMQPKYKNKQ